MKTLALPLLMLALAVQTDVKELAVGSAAPQFDLKMTTTTGSSVSLADIRKENGTLLIFTSNTCPWVHAWEDRYNEMARIAEANRIGVVFVNPNEATRAQGESMDDMKARAEKLGYAFTYAMDTDHKLADAYGATRTPHVYLMDKSNTLVYVGAIDDNSRNAAAVEKRYLADALAQVGKGQAVTTATSRALGCTIKRK
jgi:peroxiredoxin